MNLILIVLFAIVLFLYFFFRLPKESPLKEWFEKNMINIGHGFIVLWIVVLFVHDPKLGAFYGPPLALLLLYFLLKKKRGDKDQ